MTDSKEKNPKRENLKIPVELHREMSHYAIDEGISLGDVTQRAWNSFRSKTQEIPDKKSVAVRTNLRDNSSVFFNTMEFLKAAARNIDAARTELSEAIPGDRIERLTDAMAAKQRELDSQVSELKKELGRGSAASKAGRKRDNTKKNVA